MFSSGVVIMSKSNISASVDEDLKKWLQESDETISGIVNDALREQYEKEKFGRERALRKKRREIEMKVDNIEAELEGLRKEKQRIEEELDELDDESEKQAKKLIEYAEGLVSTKPSIREYESVSVLSAQEVKRVLESVGIHHARWNAGRKDTQSLPPELQEKEGNGRYGQFENREVFEEKLVGLSDRQREEIRNEVDSLF